MAFTPTEQEIYDFLRSSLPRFLFADERAEEIMGAIIKAFDAVRSEIDTLFSSSLIATSISGPPDFLALHATDRGTFRQASESDIALRQRLQTFEDALTRPTLIAAVQSILDAESIAGTPAIIELRYDRGYFVSLVSDSGVGGEFFGTSPNMVFAPTTPFALVQNTTATVATNRVRLVGSDIVFSGSTSSGNDGTFTITGLNNDRVQYTNPTGVAGVDATAAWTHVKKDDVGNVMDGFRYAYLDRGYRMGAERAAIIIILPFGSTTGTAEAVAAALREKSGAGVLVIIERRLSP